jgi:hypothetical protein
MMKNQSPAPFAALRVGVCLRTELEHLITRLHFVL